MGGRNDDAAPGFPSVKVSGITLTKTRNEDADAWGFFEQYCASEGMSIREAGSGIIAAAMTAYAALKPDPVAGKVGEQLRIDARNLEAMADGSGFGLSGYPQAMAVRMLEAADMLAALAQPPAGEDAEEAEAIWNDALWHFNPDWKTEDGFEGSRDRAIKSIARALALHDHVAALSHHAPARDGALREALVRVRDFLMSAPMESGVCCCGDQVDAHNMGSGHSPVDALGYAAMKEIERIDAILSGEGDGE